MTDHREQHTHPEREAFDRLMLEMSLALDHKVSFRDREVARYVWDACASAKDARIEELERIADTFSDVIENSRKRIATLESQLAAAQARVARLEEALRSIANTTPARGMNPNAKVGAPMNDKVGWNVHFIACAALGEKGGER